MIIDYLSLHWLDILTTILGIAYIVLEYRASILLWLVGIVMPALDIWLYYSHGLYGDAGMAVYYTLAAIYGYAVWKFGRKRGQREGQALLDDARKRLFRPIEERLDAAIRVVGAERGYDLVIDTDSGAAPYVSPTLSEDATPFVREKLVQH